MKQVTEMTTFLCPRCDRPYLSVSREVWNSNRSKYNALARNAKRSHQCPWDKKKKGGK